MFDGDDTKMTTPSTDLTFEHPELTKITGKPNTTSVNLLRREVYANARAVPALQGGGANLADLITPIKLVKLVALSVPLQKATST